MPLVALQPVTCSKCPALYRTKLQDQRGTITSSGWILRTKKFSPPLARRNLSLTSAFIGRDFWLGIMQEQLSAGLLVIRPAISSYPRGPRTDTRSLLRRHPPLQVIKTLALLGPTPSDAESSARPAQDTCRASRGTRELRLDEERRRAHPRRSHAFCRCPACRESGRADAATTPMGM